MRGDEACRGPTPADADADADADALGASRPAGALQIASQRSSACSGPAPAASPEPHTLQAARRRTPTKRFREERPRYCHRGRGFCFTCGLRGHMAWACEEAFTIDGDRIAGREPLDDDRAAVQAPLAA